VGSNFNIENGNSDVSVTVRSIAKKGNSLRVVLDSSDTNYIGCAISGVLTFS
jgi:anti-anti-sigma regulatory factor